MKETTLILRSMLRQKAATLLTVFQVGITLAVLVNGYAAIDEHGRAMGDDRGLTAGTLIAANVELPRTQWQATPEVMANNVRETTNLLKALPGVETVSVTDGFPLSNDAIPNAARLSPDAAERTPITMYRADENFLPALNLELVAGRTFEANEVNWLSGRDVAGATPVTVVSRALAELFFPGGNALGKRLTLGEKEFTIVGIADRLPGVHALWNSVELSAYVPGRPVGVQTRYLIEVTDSAGASSVLAAIEAELARNQSLTEYFSLYRLDDLKAASLITFTGTLKVLGFVAVALLVVCACGIYGQATFNVTRRTRETGIKRALGATRLDILAYYLSETWLTAGLGMALGTFLAHLLNYILVRYMGASALAPGYLVPAMLFVWLVGIAATLLPAAKAAALAPAHATRSV